MGESNPVKKKQPQSYGGIPQQGTLVELFWDLLDNFLEIDVIIGDIVFFMGLLITFYIQ
jgi:hypothetical protein